MSEEIDPAAFEAEVLAIITDIGDIESGRAMIPGIVMMWTPLIPSPRAFMSKWFRWFRTNRDEGEREVHEAMEAVRELLGGDVSRPTLPSKIRKHLCPALKSISGDAFEIGKVATPILLSLSLAGTITVPLQPLVFSMFAIVLARAGVSSACNEPPKQEGGSK